MLILKRNTHVHSLTHSLSHTHTHTHTYTHTHTLTHAHTHTHTHTNNHTHTHTHLHTHSHTHTQNGTLQELIEHMQRAGQPLNETKILELFLSLCRGLQAMHMCSTGAIAHRDIKVYALVVNGIAMSQLINREKKRVYVCA